MSKESLCVFRPHLPIFSFTVMSFDLPCGNRSLPIQGDIVQEAATPSKPITVCHCLDRFACRKR